MAPPTGPQPDPDETESAQCLHSCSMLNSLLVLVALAAYEGCYRLRWSMAASGGINSSLPVYCLLRCNLLCLPACLCTCLCGGRAGGRNGRSGRAGKTGRHRTHQTTQDDTRRRRTTKDGIGHTQNDTGRNGTLACWLARLLACRLAHVLA